MIAVSRYRVPVEEGPEFLDRADVALAALAARPGCTDARLGRSTDDPELWLMATSWESVGAYRRALGAYEVKLHAHPLMYRAIDEPSAFEDLVVAGPGGTTRHASDLRLP